MGVICRLDDTIIEKKFRRDKIDKLLTEAVQNDGFEMVYQPIYSTKQGRFRSAEALVRMKNTGDLKLRAILKNSISAFRR